MERQELLKYAVLYVEVGSRSRGLENPNSDWDYRGVYALSPRDDWRYGFSVPENMTVSLTEEGKPVDEQWFELRRFLHLMEKSSDFLEFLFTEKKNVVGMNRFGKMLRSAAHKFTNKNHAQRLIAAGGQVSTDSVEEYLSSGFKKYELLGSKNLLFRAGRLMAEGREQEARKELCDVLRRLYLANFMLRNNTKHYELMTDDEKNKFPIAHEMPNDWSVAAALYKQKYPTFNMNELTWFEEGDALFYVKHPNEGVTKYLRGVRYGEVSWEDAMRQRNILYYETEQEFQRSTLRKDSAVDWPEMFLNFYFEMHKND